MEGDEGEGGERRRGRGEIWRERKGEGGERLRERKGEGEREGRVGGRGRGREGSRRSGQGEGRITYHPSSPYPISARNSRRFLWPFIDQTLNLHQCVCGRGREGGRGCGLLASSVV